MGEREVAALYRPAGAQTGNSPRSLRSLERTAIRHLTASVDHVIDIPVEFHAKVTTVAAAQR
jgi:hypothetical protein